MKIENKKLNFEQINEIITHIAKLISKNKEKKYLYRSCRRLRYW